MSSWAAAKSVPAKVSDSIVSRKPEVSGVDAMYDIAGHDVDTSSSTSSEYYRDSNAERLQQENNSQLRMTLTAMEQDIELEVARAKETTREEILQEHKQESHSRQHD